MTQRGGIESWEGGYLTCRHRLQVATETESLDIINVGFRVSV